jgi:peroxiredoxin
MSLQDKLDAFKADFEAGRQLYNVPRSVTETMHRATAELIASVRQNKLSFPILSDVKGAAFGLCFNLPDYLIELYKRLKNDLPTFNDDPSRTLPMPARFVIGQDGTILYSEVNPDYTYRPEPEDMIPVLQRAAAVKV